MRSLVVVVATICLQVYLGLSDRMKAMQVETLVAHCASKAFLLPILPRAARIDRQRPNLTLGQPGLHSQRHELWPVIAAQIGGCAMYTDQMLQSADHALS
jgi:hypothetical protein